MGWLEDTPAQGSIGAAGWVRVVLRGGVLGGLAYGGLILLLVLRLIERPVFGASRPWTPYITQGVCRAAFWVLGMGFQVKGQPMQGRGAMVANHASWLDIFALNAAARVYFVAKSEVRGWAGIGWLARATGTLFIARKAGEAKLQEAMFLARLAAGHRLLFFPEGTSTDGLRILPFKSTLFAAFLTTDFKDALQVQAVTLNYRAPPGQDARFYGWWGDMGFGAHLLKLLAAGRQGGVTVTYHPAVSVADYPDRKALAATCERAVRAGFRA